MIIYHSWFAFAIKYNLRDLINPRVNVSDRSRNPNEREMHLNAIEENGSNRSVPQNSVFTSCTPHRPSVIASEAHRMDFREKRPSSTVSDTFCFSLAVTGRLRTFPCFPSTYTPVFCSYSLQPVILLFPFVMRIHRVVSSR